MLQYLFNTCNTFVSVQVHALYQYIKTYINKENEGGEETSKEDLLLKDIVTYCGV